VTSKFPVQKLVSAPGVFFRKTRDMETRGDLAQPASVKNGPLCHNWSSAFAGQSWRDGDLRSATAWTCGFHARCDLPRL